MTQVPGEPYLWRAREVAEGRQSPEDAIGEAWDTSLTGLAKAFYTLLVLKVVQIVTLTSGFPDWRRKEVWCSYARGQIQTTAEYLEELEKDRAAGFSPQPSMLPSRLTTVTVP